MVRINEIGVTDKNRILALLDEHFEVVGNSSQNVYNQDVVTIDEKGLVTVNGDCYSRPKRQFGGKLPIAFAECNNFGIEGNGLTSLKGCPRIVRATFNCCNNRLTSLKGGPIQARKYDCSTNKLTSLIGGPEDCFDFNCGHNELTSLLGAPKVANEFTCDYNQITTLEDAPKNLSGHFSCAANPLVSLEHLPATADLIFLTWKPNLPLLRLLNYRRCYIVRNDVVEEILNDWMSRPGNIRSRIIGCQNQLIATGFEGNAKW